MILLEFSLIHCHAIAYNGETLCYLYAGDCYLLDEFEKYADMYDPVKSVATNDIDTALLLCPELATLVGQMGLRD